MKGLYFIFAALLVLVVAIAGCVGKQTAAQPPATPSAQPPAAPPAAPPASGTPAIEGDLSAPADSGVQIEQAQTSADENVDLGSLI